jgi:hypothetical protein
VGVGVLAGVSVGSGARVSVAVAVAVSAVVGAAVAASVGAGAAVAGCVVATGSGWAVCGWVRGDEQAAAASTMIPIAINCVRRKFIHQSILVLGIS